MTTVSREQYVLILETEMKASALDLRGGKDPLLAASQLEYTLRQFAAEEDNSDG